MSGHIKLENISVKYGQGENTVYALNNINILINKGEVVSVIGKSGAGKSTLLNVIAGLEKPCDGKIYINEQSIYDLSKESIGKYRLNNIGIVFQGCYMVSVMNIRDNIVFPVIASGEKIDEEYYEKIISDMDIKHCVKKMPAQLSGGEKQRVAVARALMNRPEIILADEPTGNLDSKNGETVFKLLVDNSKKYGYTLIYVTHDMDKIKYSDNVIRIKDGSIVE